MINNTLVWSDARAIVEELEQSKVWERELAIYKVHDVCLFGGMTC